MFIVQHEIIRSRVAAAADQAHRLEAQLSQEPKLAPSGHPITHLSS